jgi:hypothetical protein
MEQQNKIRLIAAILLLKYGARAGAVARARAQQHAEIGDHAGRAIWTSVAATIEILRQAAKQPPKRHRSRLRLTPGAMTGFPNT